MKANRAELEHQTITSADLAYYERKAKRLQSEAFRILIQKGFLKTQSAAVQLLSLLRRGAEKVIDRDFGHFPAKSPR